LAGKIIPNMNNNDVLRAMLPAAASPLYYNLYCVGGDVKHYSTKATNHVSTDILISSVSMFLSKVDKPM